MAGRAELFAGFAREFLDQLGRRSKEYDGILRPCQLRDFAQLLRHVDQSSFEPAFYLDHHPGLHQSRNNDNNNK